jgi:hypothetical protein
MPLDLIVDSVDSLPEAVRGLYVEKDGKFSLDVTGIEDTSGLKSALAKERQNAITATKQAKDLAAKISKWESLGKSETEIQEMVEKAAAAEVEAAKKAGNFDALLADHKKRSEDAQRLLTEKFTTETGALKGELEAARASERGAIIENKVATTLAKEKATQEGLDLLTERLGRRIVIETVDSKRQISIMQADGKTPMAGSGADGTATIDDLVKEAKKTWPSLFEGTGAGGSGTDPRGNGRREAGGKVMSRSEFEKLAPIERSTRMKQGWTLTDS